MKKTFLTLSTAFIVFSNLSNLQASNIEKFDEDFEVACLMSQMAYNEEKNQKLKHAAQAQEEEDLQAALEASKREAEEKEGYLLALKLQEELNRESSKKPLVNNTAPLNQQFAQQVHEEKVTELKLAPRAARLLDKSKADMEKAIKESKEEHDLQMAIKASMEPESPGSENQLTLKRNNFQYPSNVRHVLPAPAVKVEPLNQQFAHKNVGGNRNSQVISNFPAPKEEKAEVISLSLPAAAAEKLNQKNLAKVERESLATFNLKQENDKKQAELLNAQNLKRQFGAFDAVRDTSNARPLAPQTKNQETTDKVTGTGKSYGTYLEAKRKEEEQNSPSKTVDVSADVDTKKALFESLTEPKETKKPTIFSYKNNNNNNKKS